MDNLRRLAGLCCAPCAANIPAGTEAWEKIIALALFHGVTPLLWLKLREFPLSQGVGDRLRAIYTVNLIRSLGLRDEQERVICALGCAEVRALPLKGPGLSERIYGDAGVRQSADVDVLVPAADLARADAVLGRLGYARESRTEFAEARRNHELLYRRPRRDGPDFHLDVHQRLVPYGENDALAESVWREGMTAENLLLHLCVNQMVHRFSRMKHALDVGNFALRAGATIRWERFVESAQSIAWTPGVAECLVWAGELTGAHVPERVLQTLRANGAGEWLLKHVLGGSAMAGLARAEFLESPAGAMVLVGCARPGAAQVRQAWRLLFPPAAYLREQEFAPSSRAAAGLYAMRLSRNVSSALRYVLLSGR